ncbi:transmembrane emp24 domain-containing protein p24delta9-like [Impatiens glandulifera]|uniref:transmembrane emp24 domain-containing protein p24delta9-like n=1 Tax=Impatiens glandulifera TaxID=253017 RepID=UPI001FB17262|nr:transmembrane emp24 domain-containing protein p24delta9-like [Impatiens glandulifera]
MMISSSTFVSFVITLGFLSNMADSLQFNLESGGVGKCIMEDVRGDSMSVGKYHIVNPNEGHPLPETHNLTVKVTSPTGASYHLAEHVSSGQFSFHAMEAGDFWTCFLVVDHNPKITLTIDFEWRTGVAAKDWSSIAKKGTVDSMETELKKLQEVITSIHEEMFYLRDREKEMQELNIGTNSTIGWLSFLSLCVSLGVAGLQFWHLKTFFQKKKLI